MTSTISNLKAVTPVSAKRELIAVAVLVALLLIFSGIVISQRQQGAATPRLLDWQVSAFYDLNPSDQAIYSALTAAADELWWLHNDILSYEGDEVEDAWPTMQQLDEYYFVSPFANDLFWEQHGAVSRTAKVSAVTVMSLSLVVLYHRVESSWIVAGTATILLVVAVFLISRPEPSKFE